MRSVWQWIMFHMFQFGRKKLFRTVALWIGEAITSKDFRLIAHEKLALQVELQEIEKFRPSHIRSMPDESKIGGSHGPAGMVSNCLVEASSYPLAARFRCTQLAPSCLVAVCPSCFESVRDCLAKNPLSSLLNGSPKSRKLLWTSEQPLPTRQQGWPVCKSRQHARISLSLRASDITGDELAIIQCLDFSWCLLWFFDVSDVLSPLPPESDWKLPLGRAMARLLSGDCMEIVRYEGKTCSKALRSRSRFSALLIFDLLLLFVFSMHDRWQLFTRYAVSFFCQNISTIHKGGQTNKA